MHFVTSQNPDDDDRPGKQNAVPITTNATVKVEMPNSSERLNLNVRTLLTISDHLRPYLADPKFAEESNNGGVVPATPNSRQAAEETFIQACAQLQLLIADRPLWDPTLTDKIVDRHMADLNRMNLETASRRHAAMVHASRPCVMMGCLVKKRGDEIVAFLSPTGRIDGAEFLAAGGTLNEALDNLDKLLNGHS